MSIVKQIILNADEEERYPTVGENRVIRNFCKTGGERLRIAQILEDNEQKIVERSIRKFWKRCPNTPSNSGSKRNTALAKRDVSWYVRLISYCLIAGSEKPLDEIGIVGVRELYNSVGIPLSNIVQFVRCLKEEALSLLSEEDGVEVAIYFEYIIRALSGSYLEVLTPDTVRDAINSGVILNR